MNVIPITKVDAGKRLVHARIDETPDRAGQVMDYATTKPNYQAWSDEMLKASGGKSLGNVRAMHGLKAAGRVVSLEFDDAARAIDVTVEVVDDDDWAKVEKGVYTGVSPGGKFARKWQDGRSQRYTGVPREISLVDMPAIPSAGFTMLKADGAEEIIAFAAPSAEAEAAFLTEELANADGAAEYRAILLAEPADMVKALFPDGFRDSDMLKADYSADDRTSMASSGEAMPDGSFPIKTKADLENAVQAYGRAKDKPAAKKHIEERAKALGATDSLPADWDGSTKKPDAGGDMVKGFCEVAQLASLIEQLTWVAQNVNWEAEIEGDGSKLPGQLAAWIKTGAAILAAMAAEEGNEAVTALAAAVAAIPANQQVELAAQGSAGDGAMMKIGYLPVVARLTADTVALKDEMRQVVAERDMLKLDMGKATERLAVLLAQPAPGGPVLRAIGRGDDVTRPRDDARDRRRAEIDKMPVGIARATAEAKFTMEFGV